MEHEIDLLLEEAKEARGKECQFLDSLIDELFEISPDEEKNINRIESKFHVKISGTSEKFSSLQYTYHYEITSNLIDQALFLEIESGINNGTMLLSYSFESSSAPSSRTVEVLKDVVLDERWYLTSFHLRKAQAILNRDKHLIFEFHRKNNYDNYVTGGHSKLKASGLWTDLHLEYIYEEKEVGPNFV